MNKGTMVEFKPEPPTKPELWNMAGTVLGECEDGQIIVGIPLVGSTAVYTATEDQLSVLYGCPGPKPPTLWNRIFWGHLLSEDWALSEEEIRAREVALTKQRKGVA